MPIAYVLAARAIFEMREAFFRQRALTRMILTMLFCLFTHGIWVTVQSVAAWQFTTWSQYGLMLLQAVMVSGYSAVLAPVMLWLLGKARRRLVAAPAGHRGRRRR